MPDLYIQPGPGNPDGLIVPAQDLSEKFSRSSGPGGQGVNTTDSRVQLSLNIAETPAFTATQRSRIRRNLSARLVDDVLTVDASEERSQHRNRTEARRRMAELLRTALMPPPPKRRATRPTRGSIERRLTAKKNRSSIKRARQRPGRED
ncbi:alternative ribosome rescue aminoacyl-tRNA hydrolase ArfB [Bowdeniella massiliensis]|uniref:alternative ribosome rescue aminoacyl-tRNA hydrolase ArfB n=1 Tax=Bowdeniella massiliensis TaxID=2932264 RepID=UPI002028D864|nr:alternative ribosome rescue aminoacyl-tRNA hydrolase ArfB [Bowdeniella massiliensis]